MGVSHEMIEIAIPGYRVLQLDYLVLDYNGTLARDGDLLPGVKSRLEDLSERLQIHVLTADTFGKAHAALAGMPCELSVLPAERQDVEKFSYVEKLGASRVAAIGNGRNDRLMLKAAALGIAVIQKEGASVETLIEADVVTTDILIALELLQHPLRLVATLRS